MAKEEYTQHIIEIPIDTLKSQIHGKIEGINKEWLLKEILRCIENVTKE